VFVNCQIDHHGNHGIKQWCSLLAIVSLICVEVERMLLVLGAGRTGREVPSALFWSLIEYRYSQSLIQGST
jgi:hypothetical protein